jgi:UDP-N-acetylglucosamine:LPS N-acetylglucosamine transferase
MILETDLTGRELWRRIRHLRDTPRRREAMAERARALGRPEAAAAIVTDIVNHFVPQTSAAGRPTVEG